MEFDVALQYPDGRIYEAVLYGAGAMKSGMEFEMYGRAWPVVGLSDGRRPDIRRLDPAAASTRILCVCVGDSLQATGS
ncbi:MAG: hypothetical protein ACHQDE_03725 [Acidimicrobiia bacterium]